MRKFREAVQLLFNFSFAGKNAKLPFSPQRDCFAHLPYARNDNGKREFLVLSDREVALNVRYNRRSGRYLLKVKRDGSVHLTIPAFGSRRHGLEFARLQRKWVERRLRRIDAQPKVRWEVGGKILFRGEERRIEEVVPFFSKNISVQEAVERYLWGLAQEELPLRTGELAEKYGFSVKKVSVRNQSSRWGSCSRRGTVSLNWRLIQVTAEVRDYIILHELAHLRHMNHSKKFWELVRSLCPEYRNHEKWLKSHDFLLL